MDIVTPSGDKRVDMRHLLVTPECERHKVSIQGLLNIDCIEYLVIDIGHSYYKLYVNPFAA